MIVEAIKYGIEHRLSDIHITENKHIRLRHLGELTSYDRFGIIHKDDIVNFIDKVVPNKSKKFFAYDNVDSLDFATTIEGAGNSRIRCQIYRSNNGFSMAIRLLSNEIPSFESLKLPESLLDMIKLTEGLIIFTGVTGSGKSTSMASLLEEINKTRKCHIVTIEDPVEYVYAEKLAKIEQREVGNHVTSFSEATRDALRQDPDVILVGEMRDLDTIENALRIAETGHLVFGTLHATSTVDTIDRVVNMFPTNAQNSIRYSLSNSLKAVVNQKLVKTLDNYRVPICEVLIVDDTVANLIRKQKPRSDYMDYMRPNKHLGNVHVVDNVMWHIAENRITASAVEYILNPNDIELLSSNIGHDWRRY